MFQYKLRSLMLGMLAVCILTWLLFVLPGEIGVVVLMCVFMVVPSAVLAGILYFRGYPQAFAIGCVPPLLVIGLLMLLEGPPWSFGPNDATEIKIMIFISQLVILSGGAASAGIRWLAVWSQATTAQTKTFAGFPLDAGRPPSQPHGSPGPSQPYGSAGPSPSRPLNPEP